jgi:hypothetical protein
MTANQTIAQAAQSRSAAMSAAANHRQMTAINAAWIAAGKPAASDLEGWFKVANAPEVMMNMSDLQFARHGGLPFPQVV